jgi:hypothetical protein
MANRLSARWLTHNKLLRPAIKALVFAMVAVCASGYGAPAARAQALEHAVKATFIYKFGSFVEWPATSFESPTSSATLCVVGEDQVGQALDKAVAGQKIGERNIVIRRLPETAGDGGCQILYVADSDPQKAARALSSVRGAGVLTVTDAARNADTTGMINFVVADNRVRFEIDVEAAAQSGLVISSKLLGLAKAVKGKG